MRHAKAEQLAPTDHERALAPRGCEDAADAGRWAATQGLVPDHAVVSTASRTRTTWECLAEAGGFDCEPVLDRALYSAGTDAALEIVRAIPAGARCAVLVGHNPTMASLVHLLDDGGADPQLFARISEGYPTAALTVLHVPGDWADLDLGGARITAFHVGRA
jgi:phosphohistidine phosphatase